MNAMKKFETKNNNVGIFVINLDRRPDRMHYMKESLKDIKKSTYRISAIDANDETNTWLDEGKWSYLSKRSMTKGEHAVHASHYKAWINAKAQEVDLALILEDDVVISEDINLLLNTDWIPDDADIIKIESHWGETEFGPVKAKVGKNRNLRRMFSLHLGAAGYLVTLKGLKKLTELIKPREIEDPLDWMLFDRRSSIFKMLTVYQIEPAPLIQMKFSKTPQDLDITRSDLSEGRDPEEVNLKNRGITQFLKMESRKIAIRIRSITRGRRRMKVTFKN